MASARFAWLRAPLRPQIQSGVGKHLARLAWIALGLSFVALLAANLGVPTWVGVGSIFAATVLGGSSIVISRSLVLAGRFGGRVPITGWAAVLIGLGMILTAFGVLAFFVVTKLAPGAEGRAFGGGAIMVLGSGFLLAGVGMWMKFALEPWRQHPHESFASRLPMLIVRTWAFGWFGFGGAVLLVAGLVVTLNALSR